MPGSLILSPHLDDAAFCMGCTLSDKRIKNPLLINVFSRSRYKLESLGDADKVSEIRQEEDRAFTDFLHLPFINLGFDDASLRSPYKAEKDYMNPALIPQEDVIFESVQDRITLCIEEVMPDVVFSPLAVPPMIDHRIVFEIAKSWALKGIPVIFYEDCGYESTNIEDEVIRRASIADPCMKKFVADSGSIKTKTALISFYKSQIDESMLQLLSQTFVTRGGERFWGKPEILEDFIR